MLCTYYYDLERKYRKHFCFEKDGTVSQKCYTNYCDGPNYEECPIYKETMTKGNFFITILCEKRGLPIDNHILTDLTNFRKNILEKDEKYRELLIIHDRLSSIIADAIRNTSDKSISEFLDVIYSSYLIPINEFILNNQVDSAIFRYQKMLDLLMVNFSLGKEYANITYYYKYPERYKTRVRIRLF